jgi:hypothetical protein
MKVRAKAILNQKYSGEYNHKRRLPGEVFELFPITRKKKDGKDIIISPEAQFSERWMERVDATAPVAQKPVAPVVSDEMPSDDLI